MIGRVLLSTALLLTGPSISSRCEASTLLDRLNGAWSGKGTIRNVDSAETERIACRLSARTPDTAAGTDVEGRCSTANAMANFSIAISPDATDEFTAVIATSVTPEQTSYRGRERGQFLALSSQSPIVVKGEPYDSSITIRFHDNRRFDMTHVVSRPGSREKQTLFSAAFTRSKTGGGQQ